MPVVVSAVKVTGTATHLLLCCAELLSKAEGYPYLAACAYSGRILQAADKNSDRRDVIRAAGIDDRPLRNTDYVDAAICALVACSVSIDYCTATGNTDEGFIVSPPLY